MSAPLVPGRAARCEIDVKNSRFIADAAPASSVEEAREVIVRIKREFADATHHVPAYLIGHGASVLAHCSDDGEPAGTAGRPILAVLLGSGLGDIVLVVTRYFGGVKLGTGGLVRAYGDAARSVLGVLPRAIKFLAHTLSVSVPYALFERSRIIIAAHQGQVIDTEFGESVVFTARFPVEQVPAFECALREISAGLAHFELVNTQTSLMPI
ncbi:MAG TPA: YigZ family protein [Anaerolineae bacterium]|nr:YigZ family protein [Anaerolineae bacterium]